MARKKLITRTFNTTKVSVLCVDTDSAETAVIPVTLPRVYKDEKEELKVIREAIDSDTFKAVKVVEREVVETLYGMTEQKFLENAEVLPPRGTKVEDEDGENADDEVEDEEADETEIDE